MATVRTNLATNPGFETAATRTVATPVVRTQSEADPVPQWLDAHPSSTAGMVDLVPKGAAYPQAERPLDFGAADASDAMTASQVTAVLSTFGVQSGTVAVALVPTGTSSDSYVRLGNPQDFDLSSGVEFTASATITLARPQGGTLNARPRCIAVVTSDTSGGTQKLVAASAPAPNTAGSHRVSVTFTIPTGRQLHHLRLFDGSDDLEDVVWWDNVLVEVGARLNPYFDGDYPDTKYATYAWTGEPNASSSTETYTGPPSITAELLASSTVPPPVRLVLSNIPAGDSYVVTGIAPGGRTWNVAGGTGVSQGVQIILDDLRAPVNQSIRYRLVVSGTEAGAYDSNALTVPWKPKNGDSKAVIQSLDGKTVVTLAAWIDNQLPTAPVINTTGFPIRGRARPVMVMATAGAGTMTVIWRLDRFESARLEQIIATGGGIALRTDGTARDLPVSDIAVITGASSALWEADNGISTDRVWELELTWIDDPEPSSVPVIYTVDDVDGVLAGRTVDEVDAMFAGQSVDGVDALDWSEVS